MGISTRLFFLVGSVGFITINFFVLVLQGISIRVVSEVESYFKKLKSAWN